MTGRRDSDGNFQVVAARGIVVNSKGQLLIVAEKDLKWHMSGGWIETLEDPLKCCEREVYEETGIEIKADRVVYVSEYLQKPFGQFTEFVQKFDLYCVCHIVGQENIDHDWKDHDGNLVENRKFIDNQEWQSESVIYVPPTLRKLSIEQLQNMPGCYHKAK